MKLSCISPPIHPTIKIKPKDEMGNLDKSILPEICESFIMSGETPRLPNEEASQDQKDIICKSSLGSKVAIGELPIKSNSNVKDVKLLLDLSTAVDMESVESDLTDIGSERTADYDPEFSAERRYLTGINYKSLERNEIEADFAPRSSRNNNSFSLNFDKLQLLQMKTTFEKEVSELLDGDENVVYSVVTRHKKNYPRSILKNRYEVSPYDPDRDVDERLKAASDPSRQGGFVIPMIDLTFCPYSTLPIPIRSKGEGDIHMDWLQCLNEKWWNEQGCDKYNCVSDSNSNCNNSKRVHFLASTQTSKSSKKGTYRPPSPIPFAMSCRNNEQ